MVLKQSPHTRRNIVRNGGTRNKDFRSHKLLESMKILPGEMNLRLSQELNSLMKFMQMQLNRAISPAINDEVIPTIQSLVESLPMRENNHETGPSTYLKISVIYRVDPKRIEQRRTLDLLPILENIWIMVITHTIHTNTHLLVIIS